MLCTQRFRASAGYDLPSGICSPNPSFLSDQVKFRCRSIIELIHDNIFDKACDEYHQLRCGFLDQAAGEQDAALRNNWLTGEKEECVAHHGTEEDFDKGSIYNRLRCAKRIARERQASSDWASLGDQRLADGGPQLYCLLRGVCQEIERDAREAGRCTPPFTLHSILARQDVVDRIVRILKLRGPGDRISKITDMINLCCRALFDPKIKDESLRKLCSFGNPGTLYPAPISPVAAYTAMSLHSCIRVFLHMHYWPRWYYCSLQDNDQRVLAEAFLNPEELDLIDDCVEVADNYCYRFMVLFKRFMHLDLECTGLIYARLQDCQEFRHAFTVEFGDLGNLSDMEIQEVLVDFREALFIRTEAKQAIKRLWQQHKRMECARDGPARLELYDGMIGNQNDALVQMLEEQTPDAVHHYEIEFVKKFLNHFWLKQVGCGDQMLQYFQDHPHEPLTEDAMNLAANPSSTQFT